MTDAEIRKLQRYLARPEADLLAELEMYDTATRGLNDAWAKITPALRQRLCVEWNWPQVRQDARFENDLDIGRRGAGRAHRAHARSARARRPAARGRHRRQARAGCLLRLFVDEGRWTSDLRPLTSDLRPPALRPCPHYPPN